MYSIKKLVNSGWTIALPAFTFSFCKSGIYSFDKTKSETGIYADWVLKEINVKHTPSQATDKPISLLETLRLLFTKILSPLSLLTILEIDP